MQISNRTRLTRLKNPAMLIVLLALPQLAPAWNSDIFKPGDHELALRHAGGQRAFVVHVPPTFSQQVQPAMVIVLHGGAGNARNARQMTGMSEKSDKEGFLAVYPQGSGRLRKRVLTWNAANCCGFAHKNNIDDTGFMSALIDTMLQLYKVDAKRIFVTGMSNGGMMAFKLACQLGDKIAAIAPVAAAFNDTLCEPAGPVSVLMFNGTLDKHVPFKGGSGEESLEERVDRSVSQTVAWWVKHNDCSLKSKIESTIHFDREAFSGGKDGAEVVLYKIKGGGHAWPGGKRGYLFADEPKQEVSATDVMWEFFKAHPKP